MASRGVPIFQQLGQYGHRIGKAPLYYRGSKFPATTGASNGNLYAHRAGAKTLSLAKYDVFSVAALSSTGTAAAATTVLNVPTAVALAAALPSRPAVGDFFEFSVVNNLIGNSSTVSASNAVALKFPNGSATSGWSNKLGAARYVQLRTVNHRSDKDRFAPASVRVRAIWTSVTPGAETLDYFFV